MKTHQFTVHNYPGSPFQFILRYEAVRMTLMESITLLEGTTKGSVIDNMGRFRAHKNVVGAMYIEKTYVPFPAWPTGLWNTVCVMASSQEKYYEVRVNEETAASSHGSPFSPCSTSKRVAPSAMNLGL